MCYNMITTLEVDYENPWIYEGRPFTSDDIGDYYGFVYCITVLAQEGNILEENTSCRNENQKEEREKLQVSPIGNDTTEVLRNLSRILEKMAEILSEEKSSPSIQPLEK